GAGEQLVGDGPQPGRVRSAVAVLADHDEVVTVLDGPARDHVGGAAVDDGDLDGLDGARQAARHLLEVGGDAPALQLVAERVPAGAGRRRVEHVEQRDGDGSDL